MIEINEDMALAIVVSELEDEVARYHRDIVAGAAKSYDKYMNMVGHVSGLRVAISKILDIQDRID